MEEITLRELEASREDMAELQRILEGVPSFYARLHGAPPGPAEAQSVYTVLPPGCSYDDKIVYGILRGGEMVGCADLVRGYPSPDTAILGLLAIVEPLQRRGLGSSACALIESRCREWPGIERIRLGVVETMEGALAFFERMGFARTGETKAHDYGTVHARTFVLEKRLAASRRQAESPS